MLGQLLGNLALNNKLMFQETCSHYATGLLFNSNRGQQHGQWWSLRHLQKAMQKSMSDLQKREAFSWYEGKSERDKLSHIARMPGQTVRCYGTKEVVGEVQGRKGFVDICL